MPAEQTDSADSPRPRPKAAYAAAIVLALTLTCTLLWIVQSREAAKEEPPAHADAVEAMLRHDNWRSRATACAILAEQGALESLPALLPRCSDVDWRVRAAAFDALRRLHPCPESASLRDTPLARREQLLLQWLDAHDKTSADALGPELCELYADLTHVEVGPPLADRCLNCHAGQTPSPTASSNACSRCHAEIHAAWAGSAHAQSLSHLRLATVDPVSRQPKRLGFGQVRGLSCTACHRKGSPAPSPTTAPARDATCPLGFRADASSDSCARCHATTWRQWQAWRRGPQPRRLDWPPGQIDVEFRRDDRSCTDCHMPPADSADGKTHRDHRWAARRDVTLLRQGIDVQVLPLDSRDNRRKIRLVLTNLSGHAYPTGSRRRAIGLHAGSLDQDDNALPLIATLSPIRPGHLGRRTEPALAPGEQRPFIIPLPPEAPGLKYRLIYHRNHLAEGTYGTEFAAGTRPLAE